MRSRYNQHRSDRLFRVVPWFIGGVFILVITMVIGQFVIMGWTGYHLVTDPEGTAKLVGSILGEIVRPVADAVRGE